MLVRALQRTPHERMKEREEDEELLSDHNSDESPVYIKVSQRRNIIYSTEQIF